jgi:signal transduction histidine kinase
MAVLVLAAVIPTALVGALAIRRARADLEREVVRGNLALIRALGDSVDGTLEGARASLAVAAALWADQGGPTPSGWSSRPVNSADRPGDDQRLTRRLLRRLRREVPLFGALSIVDADGHVVAGDAMQVEPGTGAHSFGGYIGDVVMEGGRPHVRMVSQARRRTGELVGVLIAQLDLRFIAETLAEARVGTGARLLVVDGDGVPVARSRGSRQVGERTLRGVSPAVDRALGTTTEGSMVTGGDVVVYRNLSSFQSQRGARWAILLEQPERDAYALARATTRDTIIVGAVVLALCLALGALLASRLTRPLRDLALRADAVAGGTGGADMLAEDDLPPPPFRAPGEIGVLAHRFEDMARRVGEREALQQALARGDRLAFVGTMAASVAHEVNNPLTTVLGYARLLAEDKPDEHPDRAGLDLIAGEAQRMQKIVGGLLDYARATPAGSGGASDVNQLLRRTADLLVPTARRARVELQLELATELPSGAAPPDALQQIFVNLAQNAIQAMPDGGAVTLESRMAGDHGPIEVRVIDGGPGVPAGERERVFDAFYTTKEVGTGTGLGLAVCRHLVGGFRGTLDVEEAPGGRGACFRVVIPIVTA